MDKSLWVRVFKVAYRKHGNVLAREPNLRCETVKSGLYKPGDRTFIDTNTHVTVHLFTDYFEEPKTDAERDAVDARAEQSERDADTYLQANYPDANIQGPPEG